MGLGNENYCPSCADWWGDSMQQIVTSMFASPAVLSFSHLPIFQGVPNPWIFVLPLAVAVPCGGRQPEKLSSLAGNNVHHNRGTPLSEGYSGHTQHFPPCLYEYIFLPPWPLHP